MNRTASSLPVQKLFRTREISLLVILLIVGAGSISLDALMTRRMAAGLILDEA